MERNEKRMLKWPVRKPLKGHESNKEIRRLARVECISEAMRSAGKKRLITSIEPE